MNTNLVFIILLLIVGVVLKRVKAFPENAAQSFNNFVIYISFPAVVLLQLPKLEINRELIGLALIPWIALVLSILFVLGVGRIFKFPHKVKGALLMMVPLGNTSFLGIPMIESFFGPEGIPYAIVYDQLGSFLALSIYGSFIITLYTSNESFRWMPLLKRFITFPPFLALIMGLSLRGTQYPPEILRMLEVLAATLVPLAMIAVGYQLTLQLPRSSFLALGCGLAIKLLVVPFLILFLVKGLGSNTLPLQVAVLESGMPPMISAGAVAIGAGLEPKLVASLVGIGLIISLFTLPLLHLVL